MNTDHSIWLSGVQDTRTKWDSYKQAAEAAVLASQEGRYREAEELWKTALRHGENLGLHGSGLTDCLDGLATACVRQHNGHMAEPLLKRSLQIKLKSLGPEHIVVGVALGMLAELHYMQGHFAEAEMYAKKCLQVYETACGPDHCDTARCLYNLATLNHVQGNYREAEPYYLRSIEIRKQKLGADHPETIKSLKNYASLRKTVSKDTDPGRITGTWKPLSVPAAQRLGGMPAH